MAGANDILDLIQIRPLTVDEIVKETQCPKKSVSTVLNIYLDNGTVGYFTARQAQFGFRTAGLSEGRPGDFMSRHAVTMPQKTRYRIAFGWIASDMLDTNNLYNVVGEKRAIKIERFVERLLREDAELKTNYWMDNLQNYVVKVMLNEGNRSALARFVTKDLELDLEELKRR